MENNSHKLEKSKNSQSVINIIPPREIWGPIQSIRTLSVPEARCGPHFSFLDPFLVPHEYTKAAELLREELKTFEPFEVILDDFDYFVHGKSCTLFLKPRTEPQNSILDLLNRCLKVFPQCDDTVKKGKSKGFQAHMTISKHKNENSVKNELQKIKDTWKPLKFQVKEIYFLSRKKDNPFEVMKVIPLGMKVTSPYFGDIPGIPKYSNPQLDRCALLCDIVPGTDENKLGKHANSTQVEVLRNPNGSMRGCAIYEFEDEQAKDIAIKTVPLGALSPNVEPYWIPLRNATFPALGPFDCCSLPTAKKYNLQHWFDKIENL